MAKTTENKGAIFELVERTPNQVVLKVKASDPLIVATHPYISADMAYITIFKKTYCYGNKQYSLIVTRKDGTHWSFEWGSFGTSRIGINTERLKEEVIKFITLNTDLVIPTH